MNRNIPTIIIPLYCEIETWRNANIFYSYFIFSKLDFSKCIEDI